MPVLQPAKSTHILDLPGGREVLLNLRRSAKARHILIKINDANGKVELVLPRRAAIRDGLTFANERAGWIEKQLSALPAPVPFQAGTVLQLMGEPLLLARRQGGAKRLRRIGGLLEVPGEDAQFAGHVQCWLVAEARREIGERAESLAARIGRPVHHVAIRDTATRWGSCSAAGNLSFSWRLILAPPRVLNYVVAHEVAHLNEMNHSASFWHLVTELVGDPSCERLWLRRNGSQLKRYGRQDPRLVPQPCSAP